MPAATPLNRTDIETGAAAPPGDEADQAAIRLQANEFVTTNDDHLSKCWMPDSSVDLEPNDDDVIGDRFTVHVRDMFPPEPTVDPNYPNPFTDGLNVLTSVEGPANALRTSAHQYATNRWYSHGTRVTWVLHGRDKGSGVYGFRILHDNPNGGTYNAMGEVVACPVARHNTSGPPCDLDSGTIDASGFLNDQNSFYEGVNAFRVVVEDFSGRSVTSAPMYYLYDSEPPATPTPTTGTVDEASAPIVDRVNAMELGWSEVVEPGSAPDANGRRTASGTSHYVVGVEKKVGGVWGPYRTYSDVLAGDTDPFTTTPPPTSIGIDAEPGLFRYRVTAFDNAGNYSVPSAYRHFWIDTTAPLVQQLSPTVGFEVDVRVTSDAPKLRYLISDPVEGSMIDPIVDTVGVEYRLDGTSSWNSHVDHSSFAPGEFSSSLQLATSGLYDVRGFARDGEHYNTAGQAFVCADVSIHPTESSQKLSPGSVEYFRFDATQDARIRFTPPATATKARAWIVERRDSDSAPWLLVGRTEHLGPVQHIVDDLVPWTSTTTWRVSPAVLDCTDSGHDLLAITADAGTGTLDPPTRSQTASLLGLERHWSFHELPLGGGTTSYTNIATGNLVVQRNLLSEPGRGLWTNVQLTYNSHQYGDDEQLARDGVVGAHFTLAIGNSASAATSGGLRIAPGSISLRDADGTPHVFTRPSSGAWDGYFASPRGVRLVARDITALPSGHADKSNDGIAGTVFKITRPDGLTYYYGDDYTGDPASTGFRRGRLIAIRDREGHRMTFHYECVAIVEEADGGVHPVPLLESGGAWTTSSGASGTITTECPRDDISIVGVPSAAPRRMRLVAVRDDSYAAGNGREVTIGYRRESGPLDGHINEIRGHVSSSGLRRVRFDYAAAGDNTVQLRTVTEIARNGDERSIGFDYDASLDDPGDWFDDNVLLKTVTDLRGNASRFRYTVPDSAGIAYANPRVALIENREDVRRQDEVGVIFRYTTNVAGRLAGVTRIDDQLDRRTTYDWYSPTDTTDHRMGRITRSVEPSGLQTHVAWNDDNQVVQSRLEASPVVREPVRVAGSGAAMVLNGPIDPTRPVTIELGGVDVTAQFAIDHAAGTISRGSGISLDVLDVSVSYTPAPSRTAVSDYEYHPANGRTTRVVNDQRWTSLPDGTSRFGVAGGSGVATAHDRPVTTLAYEPSMTSLPSFVTDLRTVTTPLGQIRGGFATTIHANAATGRVDRVDAPFHDGSEQAPTWSTYYDNGDLRSTTNAHGFTVAYWGYDAAGQPRHVSQRFVADAAFNAAATDAGVANLGLAEAFHVVYDADGQVTCVRDLRGGAGKGNRFTTYEYDPFGRMIAETSPFRTDAGSRLRRMSTHQYDANGNRVRSVRNRLYHLAGVSGSSADCEHVPAQPDSGVSVPGGLPDVEYDVLDRPIVERMLANSDHGAERKQTTEYNKAGDVTRVVEPLGNATATAGDYSTTMRYDAAGRLRESIDGEGRRTCYFHDQWSNAVFETSARFQRVFECPAAADQGRSVRRAFDNAGKTVWQQGPDGQDSLTLYDAESNAAQTRVASRERKGIGALDVRRMRITSSTYGVGGTMIEQELPSRLACVGSHITACSDTARTEVAPRHEWTYNNLNRLVAERLPRQLGENGSGNHDSIEYAYDKDGYRISELTRHGADADDRTVVRTSYDAYGNPLTVTLPLPTGMSDVDTIAKFTTRFTYQDDDAPLTKRDRPHDNEVSWTYQRNGLMAIRIEEDLDTDPANEWRTEQRYSYYDDGSLRTAPYTVQNFQPWSHVARGTCLRSGGDGSSTPQFVYEVEGNRRVLLTRDAPDWDASDWNVGGRKASGQARLVKRDFSSGALHTYDENGQPSSVVGCGIRTDWLERNGVGQLTLARDIHDGLARYRYGNGGELLEERVGERAFRTDYIEPDEDPGTPDPGAGRIGFASLDTPSEAMSELQVGYEYALDGSVDTIDRYRRAMYNGKRPASEHVVSTTSYDYDTAGQVELLQTIRYSADNPKAKARKTSKALRGRAKPAKPNPNKPSTTPAGPRLPRGVEGAGDAQLVYRQQLARDLAGNPRWVDETQRMAESAKSHVVRSRQKLYTYDLMQRMVSDKRGNAPIRSYAHDSHGRLVSVTVNVVVDKQLENRFLERHFYDDDTRSFGAMLPVRQWSRERHDENLKLTSLEYGSGRTSSVGLLQAGPRGQLVRSTRYAGVNETTGIEHVTSYGFTSLNQLARATDVAYDVQPGKTRRCTVKQNGKPRKRTCKVSRAQSVQSEWTHYDLLGRRVALIQSADNPLDAAKPTYTSTSMIYAGAAQDPFAEYSTNPNDPDTRWIHRVDGNIVGEVRNSRSRYMVADQQGSTVATIDAKPESPITATFDFDSYGTPKDPEATVQGPGVKKANRTVNPDSFASGLAWERNENSYGFTGMRQNAVGGTTHHHARDYNANLKGWLQTDQYMDPWSDLGLSMDPTTRDRHAYAGANPVGYVDVNGHMVQLPGGSHCGYCESKGSGGTSTRGGKTPGAVQWQRGSGSGSTGGTWSYIWSNKGETANIAGANLVGVVKGTATKAKSLAKEAAATGIAACKAGSGDCARGFGNLLGAAAVDCASRGRECARNAKAGAMGYAKRCKNAYATSGEAAMSGCGGDAVFALFGGLGARAGTAATLATRGDANGAGSFLYRGVGRDHPGYADAVEGRANPRNANSDTTAAEHNLGDTDSAFTSWTRDRSIAEQRAGADGVVLCIRTGTPPPGCAFEWSPDEYRESEVLVRGSVTGAEVQHP